MVVLGFEYGRHQNQLVVIAILFLASFCLVVRQVFILEFFPETLGLEEVYVPELDRAV